jgi:protein-disulfide isomerase
MNTLFSRAVVVSFVLLLTTPALAQPNPTKAELADLRSRIEQLQADVTEIKASVQFIKKAFEHAREKAGPVQKASVVLDQSSSDDFTLGSADAPVTIMAFIDFQCGFCAKFSKTTFRELRGEYIDTGKVRYIFRDYPLSSHPMAPQAASLANCAAAQGKYMEMHDVLFENPDLLGEAKFKDLVQKVAGLDIRVFESCLQSPEHDVKLGTEGPEPSQEVRADMKEAARIGVQGTPAFLIGKTVPPGKEMSGSFIRGDQEHTIFEAAILQALEQ